MAEASSGVKWQCASCRETVEIRPGLTPKYCIECGPCTCVMEKVQEHKGNNPPDIESSLENQHKASSPLNTEDSKLHSEAVPSKLDASTKSACRSSSENGHEERMRSTPPPANEQVTDSHNVSENAHGVPKPVEGSSSKTQHNNSSSRSNGAHVNGDSKHEPQEDSFERNNNNSRSVSPRDNSQENAHGGSNAINGDNSNSKPTYQFGSPVDRPDHQATTYATVTSKSQGALSKMDSPEFDRSTFNDSVDASPPGPRLDFSGLNPPHRTSCSVAFHAILPLEVWNWCDGESRVSLRFGHPKLGDWKGDVSDAELVQELDEGLWEVQCVLNIDSRILKDQKPLPYKYIVHSRNQSGDNTDQVTFEYLHGMPGGGKIVNRCVVVSDHDFRKTGARYHQYDNMIYPQSKTQSTLSKLSRMFRSSSTEESGVVPDHETMQERCLLLYLDHHRKMLENCELSTLNLPQFVNGILTLFGKLQKVPVHICDQRMYQVVTASHLPKVLKDWLLSIIRVLQRKVELTHVENGKRIAAVLTVIVCLHLLVRGDSIRYRDIGIEKIVESLRMLELKPDFDQKKCTDFEVVLDFIPVAERRNVADAVSRLCGHLIESRDFQNAEWLFAIPLFHFLKKLSAPFGKVELNPDSIPWHVSFETIPALNQLWKKCSNRNCRVVERYFDDLKPFTVFDPLFLPMFVAACPLPELPMLFHQIQPYLSMSWVTFMLKRIEGSLSKSEAKQNTEFLSKVLDVLQLQSKQEMTEQGTLESACKASAALLCGVFRKISGKDECFLKLISTTISIVMHSLYCLEQHTDQSAIDVIVTGWLKPLLDLVYGELKAWMNRVWGPSFGTPNGSLFTSDHSRKEVQAWNLFLSLDCPRGYTARWQHTIVHDTLTERVDNVRCDAHRIELICMLQSERNPNDIVFDVFLRATTESLETMAREGGQETSAQVEKLYKTATRKREIGTLLGNLISKKYPERSEISLGELMEWSLWPTFIKINKNEALAFKDRNQDGVQSFLPESSSILCTCAESILDDVYTSIQEGSILLEILGKMRDRRIQISRLSSVTASKSKSTKVIMDLFDERMRQHEAFVACQEQLRHLCREVIGNVEGLDELRQQVTRDYSRAPIRDLCTHDKSGFDFCFRAANLLTPILPKFEFVHRSELFRVIWQENMRNAERRVSVLGIPDIVTEMWIPALEECDHLLNSLKNNTIVLGKVDKYFDGFHSEFQRMYSVIKDLSVGIDLCLDRKTHNLQWINKSVKLIEDYWSLCQCSQTATTLLDLQTKLKLTGDFQLIKTLAATVTSSMKTECLSTIDQRLLDAGEFVRYVSEPCKLRCLQMFVDCSRLVEWIRSETREVEQLHQFVSVALHTVAGEGDYDRDRLSNLKIAGSGFASLIYGLKQNASYEAFQHACRPVWSALKRTPNLAEILKSCDNEVEWYRSVAKQSHGSVENNSYNQMDNILECGCCRVGSESSSSTLLQSLQEAIEMTLTVPPKVQVSKTRYSLDELRDLESKLVLITNSQAKNRDRVEHFTSTLQSITQIGEILLALQRSGNLRYTGWVLRVPCRIDTDVDMLQRQASFMEQELQNWHDEVKQKRDCFYQLNNFTTIQLLILRKELGVFKSDARASPAGLGIRVLPMLQGISEHVTARNVVDVVKKVTSTEFKALQIHSCADDSVATRPSKPVHSNEGSPLASVSTKAVTMVQEPKHQATLESHTSVDSPSLTESELTEPESEILATIVTRLGYHKLFVLKALEIHRGNSKVDLYEIQRWCVENADKYSHLASGSDREWTNNYDTDDNESIDSDSDSEYVVAPEGEQPISVQPISVQPELVSSIASASQTVNQFHPFVKEFVSAGYTLERSIQAVKVCTTFEAAKEYLLNDDSDEEGLFSGSSSSWHEATAHSGRAVYSPRGNSLISSPEIHANKYAESLYLTLDELGFALKLLSDSLPSPVSSQRSFNTRILECGSPNLVVTPPGNILKMVLALFMSDESLPLPSLEEILMCNYSTTLEEVILLWQRAVNDAPNFHRIFCLVNAEKLSYQVADKSLQALSEITQGKSGYRLVIICSNVDEEKSHLITKLSLCRRPFVQMYEDHCYRKYLKSHLTNDYEPVISTQHMQAMASEVSTYADQESSSVRIISSTRSGMGKSLFVQRIATKLRKQKRGAEHLVIPLHGPVVTPTSVLDYLNQKKTSCTLYHIDISPRILWQMDAILFSLLILRGLSDSQGQTWRCQPSQLYAVEVTLPEDKSKSDSPGQCETLALLHLLPTVQCLSPRQSMTEGAAHVVMDRQEFESPAYQRVYQYLQRHTQGNVLDKFSYNQRHVEGKPVDCLRVILSKCGVQNPSWAEVKHFVDFLNIQLDSCERSVFCDEGLVGDIMSGLKSFIVKFMILMSRDFATSSLLGEVAREELRYVSRTKQNDLKQYQISSRREWEQNSHPYIFFNQDGMSITFVGFMVNTTGDLLDPVHRRVIESQVMSTKLYTGLQQNKVNFNDDHRNWSKKDMIEKVATVMGMLSFSDPDQSYVLTVDNVIKMLAIQMRFRCGIPVIIMGETGCGKTRLIRYMCDLIRQRHKNRNMLILKVHGGTSEDDIIKFIAEAEKLAPLNRKENLDTVVFFDEANTTDAIGLIKEVVCDRRLRGRPVSSDLKFIAACNPYRRHSEEMIKKLESAGLGFCVKSGNTQQRLGTIPLRELVYRVLDLPQSMRPLVYDFGQLNTGTEQDYVKQIVKDHLQRQLGSSKYIPAITKVLAWCQGFMRKSKDECSFVSLRDVERAMIVFEYFLEKMKRFEPEMDKLKYFTEDDKVQKYPKPDTVTRALLLSVSLCYHARLLRRDTFEDGVSTKFVSPLTLPGGALQFREEIWRCQEVMLNSMKLGDNIAKNAALRENVFMMAICIELRIPLFLIGKPGSSKSLAKAIINDSMRGKSSRSDLLKEFKEVEIFSYQCSQLSTPEGVIEVFQNAQKFQDKQKGSASYVSVVVLDEVGLAEDSPNLPLKALHPLLEDGTEGAVDSQQVVERQKRVAFIGISNWALDPAKMNRGVMVTRSDPGVVELEVSARGICSNKPNDPVRGRLEPYFRPLAETYIEICEKQRREFFGLRDFYSLIKMLYWMCERSGSAPTWPQLEHAIKRNFGGLEVDGKEPIEFFKRRLPGSRHLPDMTGFTPQLQEVMCPDCSELGLIRTSLRGKERTWHGENRYLLFLTENYAALHILKHYLSDACAKTADLDTTEGTNEPFILFGSSFPKDREYTQVCRNINQIKLCMETGRTVILLNLENLYESLYDVLNQYYIYSAGNRYVDLGLQTNRVRCKVHDNFKLILIAEKGTVYETFPTPLINRLEKHFVLTSSVLTQWQQEVVSSFEQWIQFFVQTGETSFKGGDAFIGYQPDTPAAVVFQADKQLKLIKENPERFEQWEEPLRLWTLKTLPPTVLSMENEDSATWRFAVLALSKYLILQMASPDALIRLRNTALAEQSDELSVLYFESQHHKSIHDFLSYYITGSNGEDGLLMQVTTHSHLLSLEEIKQVENVVQMKTEAYFLHEFETELDFSNKVRRSFTSGRENVLLIIQCDSGYMYADLIACARYRIFDERARHLKHVNTHVLFVVNVPRHVSNSSFVGFQGEPWLSYHIDDLRPTHDASILPHEAVKASVSQIFIGGLTAIPSRDAKVASSSDPKLTAKLATDETVSLSVPCPSMPPQYRRLCTCIQAAASKCGHYYSDSRSTHRVEILLRLIPQVTAFPPDNTQFDGILIHHIFHMLCEREGILTHDKEWVLNEAMSVKSLQNGGTFRNVLNRKIDEVITPIFTHIIASIDKHCNLDLVVRKSDVARQQFWLSMFRDPEVMQFSFKDSMTPPSVPVHSKVSNTFKCQLPFSWLIGDVLDNHLDNTIHAGDEVHQQLVQTVFQTPLGEVLQTVSREHWGMFYKYYLHDFVRSVQSTQGKTIAGSDLASLECEVIEKTLDVAVDHLCLSSANSQTLVHRIAALHIVYKENSQKIRLFSQLVSIRPAILHYMKGRDIPLVSSTIAIHLYALEKMLDDLSPPFDKEADLLPWLNYVRISQNSINSALALSSQSELVHQARLKWQLICAMKMYVEHITLKDPTLLIVYARRIHLHLKDSSDFLKAKALDIVKKQLNQMNVDLRKQSVAQPEVKTIKKSCKAFFVELVSTLCFGGQSAPEPKVISLLMATVFMEREESSSLVMRDITPFDSSHADQSCMVRSFLLQLLLDHSFETVREYLDEYFKKSCTVLSSDDVDQNLCLLVIKCFEDAYLKRYSTQSHEISVIEDADRFLSDGYSALKIFALGQIVTLQYLEGVSQVRFGLSIVAKFIHKEIGSNVLTPWQRESYSKLLETTKQLCLDAQVNTLDVLGSRDAVGPALYLLKLLARQFGFSSLSSAVEKYHWIMPQPLRVLNEQTTIRDPFVLYEDLGYVHIRKDVAKATFANDVEQLKESLKVISSQEVALLLLSLFVKVALSRALPPGPLLPNALTNLDGCIASSYTLSRDVKHVARLLISNQQGGSLGPMHICHNHPQKYITLATVVVHAVSVFQVQHKVQVLLPFVNMLKHPQQLNGAYLPTMQEDYLQEARRVLGGQFYVCQRGHPYFVGECGRPVEQLRCNVCGGQIGGVNHTLLTDNQVASTVDATKTGHILGSPEGRTGMPTSERSLFPPAVCVVRALTHSALLWACCTDESALQVISQLVQPRVSHNLAEFFWRHLEKDIEQLGMSTGRGMDESAMIVHLVLKEILKKSPPSGAVQLICGLQSRNSREQWEKLFHDYYIQPVLCNLGDKLDTALQQMFNDKSQDEDQLFYLVHEQVSINSTSLEPHFWTYRCQISLNHLGQTLQDRKMREKYPVLHKFLQMEPNLRATRYLPDIVKFQRGMFNLVHRRLEKADAKCQTIGNFLRGITNENTRNQIREWFEGVQAAWSIVGQKLTTHTRLAVEQKYQTLWPAFTLNTPLEYLIPTTTEAGVCTTSLLDYLVLTHNDFIEFCIKNGGNDAASLMFWKGHKIPIPSIQECHLLDYEQQILSIVLSHCQYSLTMGQGQSVKYDHQALEKHIMNRFVYGKPLILSDIPQVAYRGDVYTVVTFASIRKKVKPQECLQKHLQNEILSELHTPDRLRDTLDVVDIVLAFLSSGGGRADKNLGDYVNKVLKMENRIFSRKAKESCTLGNIISLWEIVSVELSSLLYLRGKEPFDSLPQQYLRDLDGDDQKCALEKSLRAFELNKLLGTLYEFIETHVKYSPDSELRYPLQDSLVAYLEQNDLPVMSELNVSGSLPESLTIDQAVATWKFTVCYKKTPNIIALIDK